MSAVDFHRLRDERHRGRGAYPVERVELAVDRFSRRRIGRDDVEFHRIRLERGSVEYVELLREFAVAEFGAEEIAGREERFPRTVAGIFRKAFVVADDAPGLSAFEVAAEACARRNVDQSVEFYSALEEYVEHAGGKKPAHRATFQYKSSFMVVRVHETQALYHSWSG